MPVALVAVAAVAAVAKGVSANQKAKAAKHAADQQAKGVEQAQQIQKEYTDKAVARIDPAYQNARDAIQVGQEQAGRLFDEQGNIVSEGYNSAANNAQQGFQQAADIYQPAYEQGQAAGEYQSALSGALGPEAQQAAYDQFKSSPGQDWLQKRQEESILRNATALGGGLAPQTGVMQALQENAAGLAQQDFGNSYNRLSGVTQRGDEAGGAISGIHQSLAQILANLSTNKGTALGNIYQDQANMVNTNQQNIGSLFTSQGNNAANIYTGAGAEQTQLAQNLGQARSQFDLYRSQNDPAWAQGVNTGLKTYTSLGGNFGIKK